VRTEAFTTQDEASVRRRAARWLRPLMVAALLLRGLDAFAEPAQGSGSHKAQKVDRYLAQQLAAGDDGDEQVIVTVKPGAKAKALRKLQAGGAKVNGDLKQVGALSARLSRKQLRQLAEDSDIVNISTDGPVKADGVVGGLYGPALNATYSLRRTLGIDRVGINNPLDGTGVTVAVIDSGIYRSGDFGNRIVGFVDFTGATSWTSVDPYGHGTHVAGTIGGGASEVPGIASDVRFISLRVLDAEGVGTTSNVIRALQWAVENRVSRSIDIINLSLGHPIYEPAASDPLVQAVESAVRAGIVVVVSAGNVGRNPVTLEPGYGGIASPGNAPSAITVGAVRTQNTTRRTDDLMAEYSSRGPTWYDAFAKPDVVAPGHRILAASDTSMKLYSDYPTLRGPNYNRGKQYLYLSGTSMSAAVTSGTVALLLESSKQRFGVKPSPNTVKAMLMSSAFTMADADGAQYDLLTQGAGALNGGGLLALAASIDPRRPTGTSWLVAGVNEFTMIDGQVLPWARNIVWGDNLVWGDALYTHYAMWNDNIVWGDSDNIVWSDSLRVLTQATNIVWSDAARWASNIVWGDNLVWSDSDNIVWSDDDNIVWSDGDNIVWSDLDNIVWSDSDNIVWSDGDNIVWSDTFESLTDSVLGVTESVLGVLGLK
jgi:serine protease AprX